MRSPTRALQAPGAGGLDLGAIVTALSGDFAVTKAKAQSVRRARLDTFDRRLRQAGLTLEHQTQGARQTLVLSRSGSDSTARSPVLDQRWPALADVLPMGPLRDAVAPAAGVRALTVISDERRRVLLLTLRNQDQKIVARVEVDEPSSPRGTASHLSLRPLRGYETEGRRASQVLSGLGLALVRDDDDAEDNRAAAPPTTVRGRDVPATILLGTALGGFLMTMRENLPGLLADVDTEFLHDFRVAVRRTRATLKLGRPCLPEVMRTRWEPAFRGLGDLTTPVRDLDVYELSLPTMRGWLVAADPADLEPLAEHLRRRRTTKRRALLRGLRSARFRLMVSEWQQELTHLLDTQGERERPALSAGQLADASIARLYRRALRLGSSISGTSPGEDLHDLRKRCKELRYALEVCTPVLAGGPLRRALTDLKDLQDVLGRFQDSEVQRQALRGFADEMLADGTSTEAVLAMGELIGHLESEQEGARRTFDSTFARFARPSNQRMIRRLGGRA